MLIFDIKETGYPPASTSPNSPHETTSLQHLEGSFSSTYCALPHDSDRLDSALHVPGHTQSHHDLYHYSWSRRLILLIYGLNLVLAGYILFLFPYAGFSRLLQSAFVFLISRVAPWILYNFGIVWIFILASLPLSSTHYSGTTSPSVRLGPRELPLVGRRWTSTGKSYVLILVLVGGSVALSFLLLVRGVI